MLTITKSLQQTIQQLRASIAEESAELALYEKVLHMEQSKGNMLSAAPVNVSATSASRRIPGASAGDAAIEFTGNKTAFVSAILAGRGRVGASPKEIAEVFNERRISRSDNLIYNTLSALVKQKRLVRKDGRYYLTGSKRPGK